ncbi:SpoIIE family protein phosphatase [Bdellovibrio sp. HCB288]|uniref:SpoIIE family protein phosphatase n=1 Tax=Bdellovibrio sp. HCB288 TaxID=3394355 RepID=UPI0039B5AF9E
MKALATTQNWGDIAIFVQQDGFPLRLMDALGTHISTPENVSNRLAALTENEMIVESDVQSPNKLRVLFRQGVFRVYANLTFPFFKNLQARNEAGFYNEKAGQWWFPASMEAELSGVTPSIKSIFQQNSSGVKDIEIGGKPHLISFKKLPHLDVFVFEVFDKKSIFSVLDSIMNKTLLASFIILLIGLIAVFISIDSLTQNLLRLNNAMNEFSKNGSAKPLKIANNDEIGQMAKVFNSMQGKIEGLLQQTQEKARMQAELETAKEVQTTLLPKMKVETDAYSLKGYYHPASECGGDLWFHNCTEDKIFVFIGDATGHGVPAALITAATRSILSLTVEEGVWSPGKTLTRINQVLCDVAKGEKMMTAFAATIDLKSGKLTYANASHEPPLLLPLTEEGRKVKKSDITLLGDVNGKRLGHEKSSAYEEASVEFKTGQTLFAYTDGLTDAINEKGEAFAERTVFKLAADASTKGSQRGIHDQIAKRIADFTAGIEQPDDITFVSLHLRESW